MRMEMPTLEIPTREKELVNEEIARRQNLVKDLDENLIHIKSFLKEGSELSTENIYDIKQHLLSMINALKTSLAKNSPKIQEERNKFSDYIDFNELLSELLNSYSNLAESYTLADKNYLRNAFEQIEENEQKKVSDFVKNLNSEIMYYRE